MNTTMAGRLRRAGLALATGLMALAAQASTLTVTVTDKEGNPVPDTAVLLRYPVPPLSKPVAPPVVVIDQEKLRFQPYLTIVAPGTTLLFTNRDKFDHHIKATAPPVGTGPGKDFEARLPPDPTKPFGVMVTDLGRYTLGCHLHSFMRAYVLVTDTPWYARTDAEGRATLTNLPQGLAEVQVWHPEQFVAQPDQKTQLGAATVELSSTLNFNPRRRRAL